VHTGYDFINKYVASFHCLAYSSHIIYAVNSVVGVNPLECKGNYSATSNDMKLVHWQLMGGLLHLVQQRGDWAGPQPAQAHPRCTKCNSSPIKGQWRTVAITTTKGPFIATQLNSTRRRVKLSCVGEVSIATHRRNSTRRRDELSCVAINAAFK